jgi:uncharacterized Fe-S cluster-containing radical SAM superfamily protein
MNKEEVEKILSVIKIKEFVARKTLDKEDHLKEYEKMVLSKLFANREHVALMVSINRDLYNEEELIYMSLLEGFDVQLGFCLSHLFKEKKESIDNCIKRMKFNMDEIIDVLASYSEKYDMEEYSEKAGKYLSEKYGESLI